MKAIFSKLKPKESAGEEENGNGKTGNSRSRRFVQGFGTLSRATGARVLHSRQQSSGSLQVEGQESNASSGRSSRHGDSRPSSATQVTPIYDRSASVSTSGRGSRYGSPVDFVGASSTDESLLDAGIRDGGQGTSATSGRDMNDRVDYGKPLPPRPIRDTIDSFGNPARASQQSWTTGPTGPRDLQSSDKPSGARKQSTPASILHRQVSASSYLGNRPRSRTPSDALSPVSTHSQQSGIESEEKEYCKSRQSWTGMTEVDLVANLSVQERTRQEVLFEIVSSEERYVLDLIKMKETFIDMLIPPEATGNPPVLPNPLLPTWSRQSDSSSSLASPTLETSRFASTRSVSHATTSGEAAERLPIAAHFATSSSTASVPEPELFDIEHQDVPADNHGSPPRRRSGVGNDEDDVDATIRIKRTYHYLSREQPWGPNAESIDRERGTRKSLPLPPRPSVRPDASESNSPYGHLSQRFPSSVQSRKSLNTAVTTSPPRRHSRLSATFRKRISSVTPSSDMDHQSGVVLDDLKIVLQAVGGPILRGHLALSDALRKRYDEQYPLVRSLADIFIEHSYLFQEYTAYILHLEKALQQLDDCLAAASTKKKRYSDASLHSDAAIGATFQALNETANDKGETGLAIALSKPFQRLLKYPLLFQNLLFNTDATLSEYDSCMNLLEEVDGIVRSLEDEKVNKDVSEKTRDAFARIEGLERDPILCLPRPLREFIHEQLAPASEQPTKDSSDTINRRSLRRLSDLIHGNTSVQAETWELTFSDVTLLCRKIGSTALPIYSGTSKETDEGRMPNRRKSLRAGRRSRQNEMRNLYQFVGVKEWHVEKQPLEQNSGFTNLERQQSTSGDSSMSRPESIKEEGSDESESSSDDSEQMNFILGTAAPRRRNSAMPTVTTEGAEKPLPTPAAPTLQIPATQGRTSRVSSRIPVKTSSLPARARSPTEMLNSQAKFGTRLLVPTSNNGRASAMGRTIRPTGDQHGGPRDLPRPNQRAVSTPVFSTMRGSTRPPPSSVRGTARKISMQPKI